MPSISDTIQANGFTVIQSIHGAPITILTGKLAGNSYVGTMLVMPNMDLNLELGNDQREKTVIHFPNNAWPNVQPEDQMQDSNGGTWRFIKRTNNNADATVDFEVMKVVPNVDT